MTKPTLIHTLKTLFKKLNSSLPALSTEPQSMKKPGFKLFLHGTIVTIETGSPKTETSKLRTS